ncbi:mitochondrial outer membrane fission complex, WD repeat subunit Mdv1 [Schizosaccharomyces pombe]|uniref:Mitochondrial division protein 1 n=1 Tax=Schizosaccharomyces pombe (strain 972 / ATCC 24843) TaxID=284812 RepID=MDV1_SCHPO|nr:putative CCR4-Not complex subunit Caf4/Mdv1 [Schizosaccharomyces pombe]Q9P7I3.1 RecName: Full=Mitochondrial division protein 1 [Schizosaccharomyces pombe 972h-]CAB65816.2 CCR4-Not complex subunit Caf4/Mdv1 (predicted) [Schizosaccharomyces pombe]|eukprot:NP_001342939.1 putative CCR4-Not complex subunit Caf4/Mdv1 [Schizosaccharomyces pombe]
MTDNNSKSKDSSQKIPNDSLTPTISKGLRKDVFYWTKAIAYTTWNFFDSSPVTPQRNPISLFVRGLSHPFLRHRLSKSQFNEWFLSHNGVDPVQAQTLPDPLLFDIPDHQETSYSLLEGYSVTAHDHSDTSPLPITSSNQKEGKKNVSSIDVSMVSDSSEFKPDSLQHEKLVKKCNQLRLQKLINSSELAQIDLELSKLYSRRRQVLERLSKIEEQNLKYTSKLASVEKLMLDSDAQDLYSSYSHDLIPSQIEAGKNGANPDVFDDTHDKYTDNLSARAISPRAPRPSTASEVVSDYFEQNSAFSKAPENTESSVNQNYIVGNLVKQFQAHSEYITSLDFSHPFGTLATASTDKTVKVWDMAGVVYLGSLKGHSDYVSCLAIQDSFIATGSMDTTVRLWNLDNDVLHKDNPVEESLNSPPDQPVDNATNVLTSHTAPVTALALSSDDVLITGADDKTVRQWDIVTGRCIQTLDFVWAETHDTSTSQILVSDTYKQEPFIRALDCLDAAVASGTVDGLIRIWDLRIGLPVRSFIGHTAPISSLQFDSNHLYSGSYDNSVRIWDLRSGSPINIIPMEKKVNSLRLYQGRLAVASDEPNVRIFDTVSNRNWICSIPSHSDSIAAEPNSVPTSVQYKDRFLVDGKSDGSVSVFSA